MEGISRVGFLWSTYSSEFLIVIRRFYFRQAYDVGYIDAANIHHQINRQNVFTPLNTLQIIKRMADVLTNYLSYGVYRDPVHGCRRYLHVIRLHFAMNVLASERVLPVLRFAGICILNFVQLEEVMHFIKQVFSGYFFAI